ncbi:MAG: ice-binding family protein [Verrucomicrobiota bacterium]
MKETLFLTAMRNGAKRIPLGLGVALALTFLHDNAMATPPEVDLGTANKFAVLGASTVTSTGNSVVNGELVNANLGLYPGTSVTGFPPGIVNGTMHVTDAVAQQAQTDLTTAYNTAAGLTPTGNIPGQELAGLTLKPGVYSFSYSDILLDGTLTLDGEGLADPVFVFQIGSTLTTGSDSSVVMKNDDNSAPGISVFWQVGSSATLGTDTDFEGNILAKASISDAGGSTVDGRLLAETAAVTLIDTTITVPAAEVQGNGGNGGNGGAPAPDSGSTLLLLGSGLAALFALRRRFPSPA